MEKRQYPEPTVGGLIFNTAGKVLLLKSDRWKNRYSIPGGHIELGEKMEDALRREVLEETGLEVYDVRFIGIQQFIFEEAFNEKKHFIFMDYSCRTASDEVKLNWEHQEYVWTDMDEAFELPLDPYTEKLLSEYGKGGTSGYLKSILYNYKDT